MQNLEQGQRIVCRDFTGKALVRVLWEINGKLAFIHTDDQFRARTKGHPYLEAVGFPVEDVFLYSEAAMSKDDPWGQLVPINTA